MYTHTSNTVWTEQIMFRNIYVCTYMHTITISDERGQKSKREEGIWEGLEEGRERRNIFILSSQKTDAVDSSCWERQRQFLHWWIDHPQQSPQPKKSLLYLMLLPWLILNILVQVLAKVMIEEMETQHKLQKLSINQ